MASIVARLGNTHGRKEDVGGGAGVPAQELSLAPAVGQRQQSNSSVGSSASSSSSSVKLMVVGERDVDAAVAAMQTVQCEPMAPNAFSSWKVFDSCMENYCSNTFQPMVKRSSESIEAVNKKVRPKSQRPASWAFHRQLYRCTHGVKMRARGKGLRPRQKYRYLACPALLEAKVFPLHTVFDHLGVPAYEVRITRQINVHNHPIGPDEYDSYGENRRFIDPKTAKIASILATMRQRHTPLRSLKNIHIETN